MLLLIIIRSSLQTEIRWSVCMSKSHRSLYVSFSRTDAGLCIYHLFVWSNLNFWHISQWITLPIQLCLLLYSLCVNLLHSLIMWLMVSPLSPHSLHLLFCCILSILALIWLVLMALFFATIRRDAVSLLKFPFLSQVQFFSCEMLFISRYCYLYIFIYIYIYMYINIPIFIYFIYLYIYSIYCSFLIYILLFYCYYHYHYCFFFVMALLSLLHYFVLLLMENQFPLLGHAQASCVQSAQFVTWSIYTVVFRVISVFWLL